MVKRKNFISGIIVILLSGGVYFYTQYDTFIDRYWIADDVFQATFWMNKFHNPKLFPDDIYTEYSRYLRPYGVKFVYFFLTYIWDPIFAGKILGLILFCITCLLVYKLGKIYIQEKNFLILLLPLCFTLNPTIIGMFPGGFGRAFGFLFLLLFLISLKTRSLKFSAGVIFTGSLFYPLLLPLLGGILITHLLFSLRKKNLSWKKRDFWWLVFFILTSLLIIGIKYLNRPQFLGPLFTKQEMVANPLWRPNGRRAYFPFPGYFKYIRDYLFENNIIIFFFILLGLEELLRCKKREVLTSISAMVIASFALFKLAEAFFIHLYLPDRYILFIFPLLQTILTSQGLISAVKFIRYLPLQIFVTSVMIYFLLWNPHSHKSRIYPGMCQIAIPWEGKELCEYLHKKSPEIFIAADPFVADYISTFAEKKTLIRFELTQGWYKNYFKIVSQRTLDFFRVYYTDDIQEIKKFINHYNLDYIVVNLEYFNPRILYTNQPRIYIEPYNTHIVKMIKNCRKFQILKYLKKAEFISGRYFLIPTKEFFSPPPVAKPSNVFMPHYEHKCQI